VSERAKFKVLTSTPLKDGFRFPAEWERQSGTWFSWPRPEGISFPGKYHTVPANIAAIIREIGTRQLVHINVPNENYRKIVREQLIDAGVPRQWLAGARSCVRFHDIPTNESWCRDHGPAFVVRTKRGNREKAIVDWGFNAWGGKYPPFDSDDAVPMRVAEEYGKKIVGVYSPTHVRGGGEVVGTGGKNKNQGTPPGRAVPRRIVMEGGAVEFNGRGTVLTTESCLLNKNRNPGMSKVEIEKALEHYYGQTHVCWLGDGIDGDDTDGHIDDLARFLDPRTIVVAVEEDKKDANYRILKDNLNRTLRLRDQDGEPFRVVTLPMPGVVEHDGQRLPATYLNFLFVNGACLVPTFRHKKNDRLALKILQDHLPKHEVVGVDCVELIWGLGAIHCLTQQEPA
jgi:agmatine deiminase